MISHDDAIIARDGHVPVVYEGTGELGMIENVYTDSAAMVLYLGTRLAKSTRLADLHLLPTEAIAWLDLALPKGAPGK